MADELDDDQIEGLSFWEPGGYKKTTKRITDGNQLCNDFVEMVQDRCELEANYAAAMKSWAKKWGKHIDKGKIAVCDMQIGLLHFSCCACLICC